MKILYIAIASTVSVLLYYMHRYDTNELILDNVEALSYDPENDVKRVSDITEYLDENIIEVADSVYNGYVITWKKVVTSVTHTVECAPTEGVLKCKSRKDTHSKDYPEECPYAHLY